MRTSLAKRGSAPTRIEAVTATLRLSGLESARAIFVAPLNGAGAAVTEGIAAAPAGDEWLFTLNAPTTS